MNKPVTSPSFDRQSKVESRNKCMRSSNMESKRTLEDGDLLIVYRTLEGLNAVETPPEAGRPCQQPRSCLKHGSQEVAKITVGNNLFPALAIFSKAENENVFTTLCQSSPSISDAERLSIRKLLDGRVAFGVVHAEEPELLLNIGLGIAYARQVGIVDVKRLYEQDYYPLLTPEEALEASECGRLGIDRYGRSVLIDATPLELLAIQEDLDELMGTRTSLSGVMWFEEALASMPDNIAASYREFYDSPRREAVRTLREKSS